MKLSMSKRRVVKMFGVAALAVSGLSLFPIAAGAASYPIKIFGNANYLGDSGQIAGSNYNWIGLPGSGCADEGGNGQNPDGWNDCVSSLHNTYASVNVFFYENIDCNVNSDPYLLVPKNSSLANLQNDSFTGNDDANDAISSDNTSGSNTNCTNVGD